MMDVKAVMFDDPGTPTWTMILDQVRRQAKQIHRLKKKAKKCRSCSLLNYQSGLLSQSLIDDEVFEVRLRSIHTAVIELKKLIDNAIYFENKQITTQLNAIFKDSDEKEWDKLQTEGKEFEKGWEKEWDKLQTEGPL